MSREFHTAVQNVVIVQVCKHFDGFRGSAAAAMSELLACYIIELGQAAHDSAEVAGRSELTFIDVANALAAMGDSLLRLRLFSASMEEPFHRPLSKTLLVRRKPKLLPTFCELEEEPPCHIPRYMCSLPDDHTLLWPETACRECCKTSLNKNTRSTSELSDATRAVQSQEASTLGNTGVEGEQFVCDVNMHRNLHRKVQKGSPEDYINDRQHPVLIDRADMIVTPGHGVSLLPFENAGIVSSDDVTCFREHTAYATADYTIVDRMIFGEFYTN